MSPARPTLANWASVIALGVIWGGSFTGISVALQGFGPVQIATGRIVLGALLLSVLARVLGYRLPRLDADGRRLWGFALAVGILSNALPFVLLSWAQRHVTSGFAGITMALAPLFVLVLGHLFLTGERMTVPRLAGFLLGLVGVAVLIGPSALRLGTEPLELAAQLACVVSAGCYAAGSIVTRRCPPVSAVGFSAAMLLMASAVLLPVLFLTEGLPPATLPAQAPQALAALVFLGLVPTALATLILVQVIRTAGPGFLAQTNYHVPIWAVVFGIVLLGEPLPASFVAALAIILSGLAISRWRRR